MATSHLAIANAYSDAIIGVSQLPFKPSVMTGLWKTYGQGYMALDFLTSLAGRKEIVSARTETAYEKNYRVRTVTMSTVVVGGAPGASGTILLDADDLDASYNFYPRLYQKIELGSVIDGFIQAQITGITGQGTASIILTVIPLDVTKTLSSTYLASGKEVSLMDTMFAPGTDQPAPTSVGYEIRTFYTQIMKESLKFEGGQLALQRWDNIQGLGWFNEELLEGNFLLRLQEELSLIMGQLNTQATALNQTSTTSGVSTKPQSNKGLWTWIDELGYDLTYVGGTSFLIDDFYTAAEYLESKGITNDVVLFLMGGKLYSRIEKSGIAKIMGTYGGLNVNFTPGGIGGMMIHTGTPMFSVRGITFIPYNLPIFNNPNLLGITGYYLQDAGIMIPISMVKDMKSGFMVPNLMAKYLGLGSYNREEVVGTIAGMDGFGNKTLGFPTVSTIDQTATYWLTEVMFPFLEAYKGILVKRSS